MKINKSFYLFLILFSFFVKFEFVSAQKYYIYMNEEIGKSYNLDYSLANFLITKGASSTVIQNIKKIEFNNVEKTKKYITDFEEKYDISKKNNNTVIAGIKNDILYIQYAGTLALNENSYYLFASFTNLEYINGFEYINTSEVKKMTGMFYDLKKLKKIDLSSFDTSNVTHMEYMFYNCSSLTTLDVSNWNTSNVQQMNYMFYNCSSLEKIDVSNWDTSNLLYMQDMFFNCSSLKLLDLHNFRLYSNWSRYTFFIGNLNNLKILITPDYKISSISIPTLYDSNYNEYNLLSSSIKKGTILRKKSIISFDCLDAVQNILYGMEYNNLPNLEITGHIFLGWYKDSNFNTPVFNNTVFDEDGDITLYAKLEPKKYTVTWKNYDGTVLEVDENVEYGTIPSYDGNTPTKVKDAEYTYLFDKWDKEISSVTGNETYNATYKSNKRIYIDSIILNKYTLTLNTDDTYILIATINPNNTTEDKTLTWISSNPKVVTVDNNGKVTALSEGNAIITVSTENNIITNIEIVVDNSLKSEKTLGDIDNDGIVTLKDVILILRKYLGIDEEQSDNDGDVDGDGSLGLKDVILLLRMYLGIE